MQEKAVRESDAYEATFEDKKLKIAAVRKDIAEMDAYERQAQSELQLMKNQFDEILSDDARFRAEKAQLE